MNSLKRRLESTFRELKLKYPIYFQYPYLSDHSGHISIYTAENEDPFYSNNEGFGSLYQDLQFIEYIPTPSPSPGLFPQ